MYVAVFAVRARLRRPKLVDVDRRLRHAPLSSLTLLHVSSRWHAGCTCGWKVARIEHELHLYGVVCDGDASTDLVIEDAHDRRKDDAIEKRPSTPW